MNLRSLSLRRVQGVAARAVVAFPLLLALPTMAAVSSPDDLVVRGIVDRALAYLDKAKHDQVGGKCLIGLAIYKATGNSSHPQVQAAVAAAQAMAAEVRAKGFGWSCYNATIACIFLCELNSDLYRSEIGMFLAGLLQRQRPEGWWTYETQFTTDTSQTQYGMLALWSTHAAGFTAPLPRLEGALHYLMRTQGKNGSFYYQPEDPGVGKPIRDQENGTLSMTVAGAGSLYLGAHLLGAGKASAAKAKAKEDKPLPTALQKVNKEVKRKEFATLSPQTVNLAQLKQSCSMADDWLENNFAAVNTSDLRWTYYYLYGLERYESFKELIEGASEPEPAWYNAAVESLQKSQQKDGSWDGGMCGVGADTAFAVLCLVRSTQKSIKRATIDEGLLIGGKSLPKDLTNIRLQDGQVITPQMIREVDDLLDLVKNTEEIPFDATSLPRGIPLDEDLTRRSSQLEQLRELVNHPDFHVRLAAVKTLARERQLDNVPVLIYALGDPDLRVVVEARDGLRFISRKFAGFGLSAQPSDEEKRRAQAQWKQWYLSIRPGAELLE